MRTASRVADRVHKAQTLLGRNPQEDLLNMLLTLQVLETLPEAMAGTEQNALRDRRRHRS